MTHEKSIWARAMGGTLATAALIAAMSGNALAQSPGESAAPGSMAPGASGAPESMAPAPSIPTPATPFVIGYSNGGGVGNGFREEQVCTAKAEATALGPSKIAGINVIHRVTDAAGQLSDIRDLISKGVKAIVFNPNDP